MTQPSNVPVTLTSQKGIKCWLGRRCSTYSESESSLSHRSAPSPNPPMSEDGTVSPCPTTVCDTATDSALTVQMALMNKLFQGRRRQQRSSDDAPRGDVPVSQPALLGRPILCRCRGKETGSIAAWLKPSPQGPRPAARFGHSAVPYLEHLVVVFGGKGANGCLNDLWIYDAEAQQWAREMPREGSAAPRPRSGHAAVIREDALYVLGGGGDDESADMNDLWRYQFTTGEWTCLEAGISGCPVKGHTLQLLPASHTSGRSNRDLLLCFGGLVRGAHGANDANGSLVPSNTVMLGRVEAGRVRWSLLRTSGQTPCPRSFQTAEFIRGTALLLVFGGRTTKAYYNAHANDPDATGNLPREHRNGANVLLNDVHVLNAATGVWQRIVAFTNTPPPRSCAASVWGNGRMMIFGGGGRTCEATNYELNMLTRSWRPVAIQNQPLASCPTVTAVQGKLVFFGGCGPDGCLSGDVLELPLLPVSVKAACAEWLHRLTTDALLYAESPAARDLRSKFAKRPGEGHVTLSVNNLTRPHRGERYVPGWHFASDIQKLHELADKDPSVAAPPLQVYQNITADGMVEIRMSYDSANPFDPTAFFGPLEAATPQALPEPTAVKPKCSDAHPAQRPAAAARLPQRPSITMPAPRRASPPPAASSPVAQAGPVFASQPAAAEATPAAATAAMARVSPGSHCSPRTPWFGQVTPSAATASALGSPTSHVSSRSAASARGPLFTGVPSAFHRHVRSTSSDDDTSSRSSSSEDSVAYVATGVGLAEGICEAPSRTPTLDLVRKACHVRGGAATLRTQGIRPDGLIVEALEGPRGPFLVHSILSVSQQEYRLANNR